MRFPKETRALIHRAGANPVSIPWPAGAAEPQEGRVYWVQSAEDLEAEHKRREESPDTCAEVMASMNPKPPKTKAEIEEEREENEKAIAVKAEAVLRERFNGDRRQMGHAEAVARFLLGERAKRRRNTRAPLAGSERILVIDAEILDTGWTVKVAQYEDPDPIHHLRVKGKVSAGPNPIEGYQEPTELEPEQMPPVSDFERRREEEEALKIEHKASVDTAAILKAEDKLLKQRRKGKRSVLGERAVDRARKRAELVSAA